MPCSPIMVPQHVKPVFLDSAEIIETVAERLSAHSTVPLVVDPVLVNHKGQGMFPPQVAAAYSGTCCRWQPSTTPNWREAALLAGYEAVLPPSRDEVLRIS